MPADNPALVAEAIQRALELAPGYARRTHVSRAVNNALGLDWTDAKWRGIWQRHPGERWAVDKQLGTGGVKHERIARIGGNVRGAVVTDAHAPFQDDDAIRLACKVIKWWKPDLLVFDGDETDFYGLSRFDRNPGRQFSTQDEVDVTQGSVLVPIRAALPSGSRAIKVDGNHCDRLRRYLWTNPELFSVRNLSLPALLELDRIGIEYAPYAVEIGDTLHISHGTKVSIHAGYAAKAELVKRFYQTSTITGHNHRAGRHVATWRGRPIIGQEVACLCSLDPEYQVDPNWTQGMALFEVRDGKVKIEHVDFYSDYTCCIGGRWFGVD